MAKIVKSRKPKPGLRAAVIEGKPFGHDHGMKHNPDKMRKRKVKHI